MHSRTPFPSPLSTCCAVLCSCLTCQAPSFLCSLRPRPSPHPRLCRSAGAAIASPLRRPLCLPNLKPSLLATGSELAALEKPLLGLASPCLAWLFPLPSKLCFVCVCVCAHFSNSNISFHLVLSIPWSSPSLHFNLSFFLLSLLPSHLAVAFLSTPNAFASRYRQLSVVAVPEQHPVLFPPTILTPCIRTSYRSSSSDSCSSS